MTEAATQSAPHARSVFIAALLFLLGDKSDILAELAIRGYDQLLKERSPHLIWIYELSLVGLAFGTCFVIVATTFSRDRNHADDVTIAIGVVTSTIAGLLNIAEMWFDDEVKRNTETLSGFLFFYVLWLLLIIFPLLRSLVVGRTLRQSGIVGTALTLVVAALVSVVYRFFAAEVLWKSVKAGSATSANGAFDRLIFNSDTLIILGATWSVMAFFVGRSAVWKIGYLSAAGLAGMAYPLLFDNPSDWPAPYPLVVFGFTALSVAAILPMYSLTDKIWLGDTKATCRAALLCFLACALVMAGTLARVWDTGGGEFAALVLVQGGAGAFVPLSVFLAGRSIARVSRQSAE